MNTVSRSPLSMTSFLLRSLWLLWCALVLLMGSAWAANVQAIPKLTQPVMDTANMLSPEAREQLNQDLLNHAREQGSQIAVLTVDTTAPEDIFSYGMRVVEAWRLGRAEQDDGVLLLVAKKDRKNQILVGRGLEGAITDLDASHILNQTMRPYFQAGDFDGGVRAAVVQLQGLIAGEALPKPTAAVTDEGDAAWAALLLPLLLLSSALKRVFGTLLGSVIGGALVSIACLLLGTGWLVALAAAVGVILFSLLSASGVLFFPGGGHGGGSWGGSSHGGGFGSGGGDFGGGGASGDW